jgi:hypothetical protein
VSIDAAQLRVLGCLLEKQRTTPDQYPLSLNALRLACNQTTARDPVVSYDERTVHVAAQELGRIGWARLASGQGSRAVKYRQLVTEALGLTAEETSLLTVLMLRGPQTPGELKQRSERLHRFDDLSQVDAALERLVERELVQRLGRRPGQKEERFRQLLGGEEAEEAAQGSLVGDEPTRPPAPAAPRAATGSPGQADELAARVDRLEDEVAALRRAVDRLVAAREQR